MLENELHECIMLGMARTTNRSVYSHIILGVLAVTGVIVALAVAPGFGGALRMIDRNPYKAMEKLERALRGLIKRGRVIATNKGYQITDVGMSEFNRREFNKYQLIPKKHWDGKWRVVCFDIPEKRKLVRRAVQRKLSLLGFYPLQNSVFISPHSCTTLVELAQRTFHLQKNLRIMTVTHIDNEQALLKYFKLSR